MTTQLAAAAIKDTKPELGDFATLLMPILDFVSEAQWDEALEEALNRSFPGHCAAVFKIEQFCHAAIAAGWMCAEGSGSRRFGRVLDASLKTNGMSVDVVDMTETQGSFHRHPAGEVCLVLPVDGAAKFDGQPRGWTVYSPGSAHSPAVTGGRALVLYLLPGGQIEFQAAAEAA